MATIENQIESGKFLLNNFRQLDSKIIDQQLTQDKFTRDNLISDINYFKQEAEKYVDGTQDIVDSKKIHLNSREHEYVNDEEVDKPALRDFYSYGITIKQIIEELERQTKGSSKTRRKYDGKFYYLVEEKIIYLNDEDMAIKSRELRRETLCRVVFRHRCKWVDATDIETERAKNYGGIQYEIKEPYEWIRKSCNDLNKQIKEKFKIDYELFEKENQQIRLNPKAK